MGSIVSSIRNGITAMRECHSSVEEMKQNVMALKKGMNNVLSIVKDMECISKEAKITVDICCTKCQNQLYESIYEKLTDKEKMLLGRVSFYEDIIMELNSFKNFVHLSENEKIFRENCYSDFLTNIKELVMKHKGEYLTEEDELELFNALLEWLDRNIVQNTTTNPHVCEVLKSGDSSISEKPNRSKEWIEMKLIKTNKAEALKSKTRKANITFLSKLQSSRKENDFLASKVVRRIFCKRDKIEENISTKFKKHLQNEHLQIPLKVKASVIQRILKDDEPNYSEVYYYTSYMKKVRHILKKALRYEEIKAIDVKPNFKLDVNLPQYAEKIDEAAVKMQEIKRDAIGRIHVIREDLLEERTAEEVLEKAKKIMVQQASITEAEHPVNMIMAAFEELANGQLISNSLGKNNYENWAAKQNLETFFKLLVGEKNSQRLFLEAISAVVHNIERYNKVAAKKDSYALMLVGQQLNQIINILIEESQKPSFLLHSKMQIADYRYVSTKMLAKAVKKALLSINKQYHEETCFNHLKRTLSLPNFNEKLLGNNNTTAEVVKAVVQILNGTQSDDLSHMKHIILSLMKRLNDAGLPLDIDNFIMQLLTDISYSLI